jgi:hypothetical protein
MRSKRYTALLATVLVGACLGTPARAQDEAVTLKHGFKAGDTWQASFDIVAEVSGTQVPIKRTTVQKVKEVKQNGDVVLVITDKGGTLVIGGDEQVMSPEAPVTITLDPTGKLVKYEDTASGDGPISAEAKQLIAMMGHCIFPKSAVKKGDTWTTETPNPFIKDAKLTIKSAFEGTEKVQDKEYLKVKQSVDVQTSPGSAKTVAEMVFLLDPQTHEVARIQGSVKGLMTQFGEMDWGVKVAMKRVTEEK